MVKNSSIMKEVHVHEVIHGHNNLQSDVRDSTAPSLILFSTHILALSLKSEKFVINSALMKNSTAGLKSAGSNQEIEEFFNHSHLRKTTIKDVPVQWKFMDKHCHMTQYVFQVKNYLSCIEHPIHMPVKVLDSFHYHDWTGQRSNNCPFNELFGEEPSDDN